MQITPEKIAELRRLYKVAESNILETHALAEAAINALPALLDRVEELEALLRSANRTYLGGEYVAILHPDHVDVALSATAAGEETR